MLDRYLQDPTDQLTPDQFERARQAYINRKNASKSTGPTSEAGKKRSAQNARRHGYAGATVVIEEEDIIAYNAHLTAYFLTFQPVSQPECDTVRRAANAQWRYDRLISIETGLLDLDLSFEAPIIDAKVIGEPEHHHRLAFAFLAHIQTGTNALDLCRRYLITAQRDIERSIKMFYFLQKNRTPDAGVFDPASIEPLPEPQEPQSTQQEPNEPAENVEPGRPEAMPAAETTQNAPNPAKKNCKCEVSKEVKLPKAA
jgi:hypothetical protein